MATTSATRLRTISLVAAVAGVIAATLAWMSPGGSHAAEPEPFWPVLFGVRTEVDVPIDVDEITQRSDTVVVAHVTDVATGRVYHGYGDPTPPTSALVPLPTSVFVKLTVDKVVRGDVARGQVLDLELFAPPLPMTAETMRSRIPAGQSLFFLNEGSAAARRAHFGPVAERQEKGIYSPQSSLGLLSSGADGLVLPFRMDQQDLTFVRSFSATTVDGAANRAAQSVR